MESIALSSVEFRQLKKARQQRSQEAEFPQQPSTEDPVGQQQRSQEAEFPQQPSTEDPVGQQQRSQEAEFPQQPSTEDPVGQQQRSQEAEFPQQPSTEDPIHWIPVRICLLLQLLRTVVVFVTAKTRRAVREQVQLFELHKLTAHISTSPTMSANSCHALTFNCACTHVTHHHSICKLMTFRCSHTHTHITHTIIMYANSPTQ